MTKVDSETNPFSEMLTCQVCGYAVLALEGFVARHRHKRVKGENGEKGYMTNGCAGSRERPFENDRAILALHLPSMRDAVEEIQDHYDQMNDLRYKKACEDDGLVVDDVTISHADLFDKAAVADLRGLGFINYEAGNMDWDKFWGLMSSRVGQKLANAKLTLKTHQARYDNWTQTITDDQWTKNRDLIVHVKRSAATVAGWDVRAPDRPKPKAVVAMASVDATTDANDEIKRLREELRLMTVARNNFAQIVAEKDVEIARLLGEADYREDDIRRAA